MTNFKIFNVFGLIFLFGIFFITCCKEPEPAPGPEPEEGDGKIILKFDYMLDNQPLEMDTLKYVNEAGNHYEVHDVRYFISDVTLHKSDGSQKIINEWEDLHYVDIYIPSTQTWEAPDKITEGTYDYITFTFGLEPDKNISYRFTNPPESDMIWAEICGGGYHYLILDGRWVDTTQALEYFAFHLGKSPEYDGLGNLINSYHNQFTVTLPNSSFTLQKDETKEIQIVMNIENWFRSPNTYDHNAWGGYIMATREAIELGCENGHDVFTVGYIQ
ncbi:MAG: MbnP family protein [Bacteroidota bacterium]